MEFDHRIGLSRTQHINKCSSFTYQWPLIGLDLTEIRNPACKNTSYGWINDFFLMTELIQLKMECIIYN